jgi:hypothetical protein
MSPHQILAVAGRLFVVWLAIHLPGQVLEIFTADSKLGDVSTMRVVSASVLLIEVVVMFALWFFPQSIARRLLTSTASDAQSPSSADTWLRMGCALIKADGREWQQGPRPDDHPASRRVGFSPVMVNLDG